jgi:hypothetical protein
MAFGATVSVKALNLDLQTNVAGTPPIQTAHKFFHSTAYSSIKSDTTIKTSLSVVGVFRG